MRYYDLTLTNPKTGAVVKQWSSMPPCRAPLTVATAPALSWP
ncbi:hypothetical protein [Acidiphilium multivorum]